MKVRVIDPGRCGADTGDVIKVGEERGERWIRKGWAAAVESAGSSSGSSTAEKLPKKKDDLLALYASEIGSDPSEDLEKVTVKTLTEAIEAHRAAAGA